MFKPKRVMLATALAAVAVAVPVSVAGAEPEPMSDPAGDTPIAARSTPATITVTATVAPGQCAPVAGGPEAVEVTDTVAPAPNSEPGAGPVDTQPVVVVTDPGSSRFDPYTCAPVPAEESTDEDEDGEGGAGAGAAPVADIPSYTPTLNPYPGQLGNAGGDQDVSDPLSAPTTTATIVPTTTATPTTTTAVVAPTPAP